MSRLKTACLLALALALTASPSARAQSGDLGARLPADTLLYVYWRGAGSLQPGSRNTLVSLWNDPGFQPMRRWIVQGLVDATAQNPELSRVSRQDMKALLADPFVLGIRLAATKGSAKTGPTAAADGFLIVRVEGPAGRQLRADLEKNPKAMAHVRFTRSGLMLASGDGATLGALARRFGRSAPAGAKSLATLASYREARAEIAGRPPVEFFMRVPEASALAPRKASGFDTKAFLDSLHLERVRLLCGWMDLNASSAFMHFAILGNPSPGSLFDLFGANVADFQTLAAAPAGGSVSVSRLDIGAVLSLLTNAFSAGLGRQRALRLEMVSGLLASAVVPALGGEYAVIWPRLTGSGGDALLALTVKSQPAEELFSTTLGPFLRPAGEEGGIRYFQPAMKPPRETGKQGAEKNAVAQMTPLLALTPKLLLAGTDHALVRHAARAVMATPARAGLAGSARFRAARAELPAALSGLTYFDLQSFEWTKWLDRLATKVSGNEKDPHAAERAAALRRWASHGGGAVLARHVHLVVAGSWKDAHGMHWLGNIQ